LKRRFHSNDPDAAVTEPTPFKKKNKKRRETTARAMAGARTCGGAFKVPIATAFVTPGALALLCAVWDRREL
jgi:hypothetical protein